MTGQGKMGSFGSGIGEKFFTVRVMGFGENYV